MKWIGITGGIAAGKSTVGQVIKKTGLPILEADELAHRALEPDSGCYTKVCRTFGEEILDKNGNIDRKVLGAIVFENPEKRRELEAIVHPWVRDQALAFRKGCEAAGEKVAFYLIPLLFEKNLQAEFDQVLAVVCDEKVQLERLMKRNSLSEDEAKTRIASQLSMKEKAAKADDVIINNNGLKELESQVKNWLEQKV